MKLAASRSLLQGTVAARPDSERRAGVLDPGHQVVVAGRDGEPVLARHGPVALLDGEHVEVTEEPRAGVQQPAGAGDPADVPGLGHVGVAEGAPVDVAEHQQAVLGTVGHHRGADAGLRRGHRVVMLVVPVDRQHVAAGPDPGHERAVRRGHLVIPVGEPAGKLRHRSGGAGQGRYPVEQFRDIEHEMRLDPKGLDENRQVILSSQRSRQLGLETAYATPHSAQHRNGRTSG